MAKVLKVRLPRQPAHRPGECGREVVLRGPSQNVQCAADLAVLAALGGTGRGLAAGKICL